MSIAKNEQIEHMLALCRTLNADVRYSTEHGHIVVQMSEDQQNEKSALSIQRAIQEKAAQYPNIVCYCFDAFSMLIYAI